MYPSSFCLFTQFGNIEAFFYRHGGFILKLRPLRNTKMPTVPLTLRAIFNKYSPWFTCYHLRKCSLTNSQLYCDIDVHSEMMGQLFESCENSSHDDVIKWKHFPRYWPLVRGIHRSPVNSPHKGQWRGALMFSLICTWIKDWVNNGEAGDLRRYRAHYDVIVMSSRLAFCTLPSDQQHSISNNLKPK